MFDHHSREHAENWRAVYAEARGSCPVVHSDNYGGYEVLTRHADVLAAATDFRRLASGRTTAADGSLEGGIGIPSRPVRIGFLEMDPPESTKYRRLINKWFTRGAIERGRSRIVEIANWAIDQIAEEGACDVIGDLASPFQRTVLLDMLGLPLDVWHAYKSDLDEEHAAAGGSAEVKGPEVGIAKQAERAALFAYLHDHLQEEIVRQRRDGGPGLVADLVAAEVDGAPITQEVATELVMMLVGGGEETTVATVASMLLHLATAPDWRTRLREDPSAIPVAVDEILRYYSPASSLARTVVEPVTIDGHEFHQGDRVLLAYSSANYDDEVFNDPGSVDLARTPNPHLSFGAGAHRCIGALLARANVECFVGEFLRRIPDFEIEPTTVHPAFEVVDRINTYYSMPIRFSPTVREGSSGKVPVLLSPRIQP
ncbi:cytochrome P450 [Amycolatopsis sp.]|jgi:cytochrome P450|uniref:cytochrome P450 n=1 Tax=Amycolatopsis sp. TaxID=37632 RepID=UPI002DF90185|nr:cytochrome P450 [Amycolatopsis sp.]